MNQADQERINDRMMAYHIVPVRAPSGAGKEERGQYVIANTAKALLTAALGYYTTAHIAMESPTMVDGDYSLEGILKKTVIVGIGAAPIILSALGIKYAINDATATSQKPAAEHKKPRTEKIKVDWND